MRVQRHFTKSGGSAYAGLEFRTASSEIRNPDGSVVFSATDIEVPAEWSQVACDVLAQKYFRKAGVPARLKRVAEKGRTGMAATPRTRRRRPGIPARGRTLRR